MEERKGKRSLPLLDPRLSPLYRDSPYGVLRPTEIDGLVVDSLGRAFEVTYVGHHPIYRRKPSYY